MDESQREQILDVMNHHKIMTIATVRPDGYPQATTVTYANDGLTLYFVCGKNSQKVNNLNQNRKVSLTIDHDEEDWNKIHGVSLGGTAHVVERNDQEFRRARDLMVEKFPQMGQVPESELQGLALVKVEPEVISLLDYTKGFGHTELVRV